MTAEDKKDVLYVIKPLLIISLIVVGSSIFKFHIIDIVYLGLLGICFLNYLYAKFVKKNV